MIYKIKSKKKVKSKRGRPKATYKIRSIKGITPKGFDSSNYKIVKNKIIFKKKRKRKNEK